MNDNFLTAVKNRRTFYGISKEAVVTDEKITEIINDSVKYAPTAFNSQSGRIVLLLGEHHNKLWDITKETLRNIVPPENFSPVEEKMNNFRNGYGSVLFFEDQTVIEELQKQFSLYADNFPIWAQHSTGMLQYIIWTSLEVEGFGASLQHYNPLIDDKIRDEWNIPTNWKLTAQLPFGKPSAPPLEKDFKPLDERIKIFK